MRAGLLHATSNRAYKPHPWRGAGAVERGGLENRCASNRTEGSNPSLSAKFPFPPSRQRPEQGGFRSHDADFALPGLDALGQRAQMIPPITVSLEVDMLASGSGELADRRGVDGIVPELSCLY